MITLRKAEERGHADHGWLDSWHTFSFADYHDPAQMGWGALRVINEDVVEPGKGFGKHGHRDMEIITYLLQGSLEHRDSMGNGEVIRPGEVQRMSAGRGVMHSEFNPSATDPVHLLQIWIEPRIRGVQPSYEQKLFTAEGRRGRLQVLASPDGREGSVVLNQHAFLYAAVLEAGASVEHALEPGRLAYVHGVRGRIRVGDVTIAAGDGAKIGDETALKLTAEGEGQSEFLLFDLPPLPPR
ncbi:MAG: pirin family protein [Rhodocyclaceae bacterium]